MWPNDIAIKDWRAAQEERCSKASLKDLLNKKVLKKINGIFKPKETKGYMTQRWKVNQTIKESQSYKVMLILLECKIKYNAC